MSWRGSYERKIIAPRLEAATIIKGAPIDQRQVWRVDLTPGSSSDATTALLKFDRHDRLRPALAAARGQSPVAHEFHMLSAATTAGLDVPRPLMHGRVQRWLQVRREALLCEWIADSLTLRECLRSPARAGNDEAQHRVIAIDVAAMTRIRLAGMTDSDLGLGNLMIAADADLSHATTVTWIDLEAARHAPPHDARATADMIAAAMVSWWHNTGERAATWDALWQQIMRDMPEPEGGWNGPVLNMIRDDVATRIKKQLRVGRIKTAPPLLANR